MFVCTDARSIVWIHTLLQDRYSHPCLVCNCIYFQRVLNPCTTAGVACRDNRQHTTLMVRFYSTLGWAYLNGRAHFLLHFHGPAHCFSDFRVRISRPEVSPQLPAPRCCRSPVLTASTSSLFVSTHSPAILICYVAASSPSASGLSPAEVK